MKYSEVNPKTRRKSSSRSKRTQSLATNAKPGSAAPLSHQQVALLRESFARLEPQATIAAMIFYRHLFTLDPSLRAMFHTSIELQGRKLMDALGYTMASLEKPQELIPVLEALGRRHVTYGTKDEHYATVNRALLQTLSDCLCDQFTPQVEGAWEKALNFVSGAMQRGAKDMRVLMNERDAAGTSETCPFGH